MKKTEITLIAILILVLAGLMFWAFKFNLPQQKNQAQQSNSYQSLTDDKGAVSIEVTPVKLVNGQPAVFDLKLNTHSVELDYDLASVSKLTVDGSKLQAVSWSGGRGGHHLSGQLSFPQLPQNADKVKLVIASVDNVDREFNWRIN